MQTLVHLKAYKIEEFRGWSVHLIRKKSFSLISEFSALNGGFGHIINKRVIMNFKSQVFHHFFNLKRFRIAETKIPI